jgi:hypothetical protein
MCYTVDMPVQWNTVTWYSKLIALILFVALPFVGFYLGMNYGKTTALLAAPSASQSQAGDYYAKVAAWQTDNRTDAGFSIAYPIDFSVDDNIGIAPAMDWRVGANGAPGLKRFTLTIPASFEPQTNLIGATLTVGDSQNNAAIANCLKPDASGVPGAATSTATINGVTFNVFTSSDAGAGNYYETTSYRALHAGACVAIEYTIHSAQIANYPAAYGLKPLDENKITDVLSRIVGTFNFL